MTTAARTALALALLATLPHAQGWFDSARILDQLQTISGSATLLENGDVDGDGDVDLIAFWGSPAFPTDYQVLFNDGSGGFTDGPLVPLPAGDFAPLGLGLPDVTGDGDGDLLFERAIDLLPFGVRSNVEVFPGNGDGTFGAPVSIEAQGRVTRVAVADIGGGAALEIATGEFTGVDLDHLFRWWSWDGAGFTPSASVVVPGPFTGAGVGGVAAYDATDDGVPDLVYGEAEGTSMHVLETVAGAPVAGTSFALPIPSNSGIAPLPGDLDGDGDEDLLVVVTRIADLSLIPIDRDGATLTVGAAQFFPGGALDIGFPDSLVDWDGDGDLDITAPDNGNPPNQPPLLGLFENDGQNGFQPAAAIPFGGVERGVGTADYDGDGNPDYAGSRTLIFGSGVIESVVPDLLGDFDEPGSLRDREGDGDVDYFEGRGIVSRNDGTGAFSYATGGFPSPGSGFLYEPSVAVGDLNGDGAPDFLVPFFSVPGPFELPVFEEMHLIADDGVGGYLDTGAAAAPAVRITRGSEALNPTVDLDLDGDVDVLDQHGPPPFGTQAGGFWPNDGTGFLGTFREEFGENRPVDAADVDGDGDVDVLSGANNRLNLQRNDGSLNFSAETLFTNLNTSTGRFLDLDLDGDLDAVASGTFDGTIHLFENQGGPFVAVPTQSVAMFSALVFGVDDVDGDGTADLLVGARDEIVAGERLYVLRGQGALAYDAPRAFHAGQVAAFDDIDGDGDVDVVGELVVKSRRFAGADAGRVRQYGSGTPGSGGAYPVLGAEGPLRPGSTTAALHVRNALGGTAGLLLVGLVETEQLDVPLPGYNRYVQALVLKVPVVLGGPVGVPGAGTYDLDLTPLLPLFPGVSFYQQVALVDPAAPSGVNTTNGLELTYGL